MKALRNKLPKLNICCAQDDLRPVLAHVYINGPEVVACDGHVLVVHKIEELFSGSVIKGLPERAYIPASDWTALTKKFERLEVVEGHLVVHSAKGAPVYVRIIKPDDVGVYPNYRRLSPEDFNKVPTEEVVFNPNFLLKVKDAMTTDRTAYLKLEFTGPTHAIRISLNLSSEPFTPRV